MPPKISEKIDSPALAFVRHLYRYGQEATGHSWVRLNGALRNAVECAIEGGLLFDEGDFSAFYKEMRGGYWLGTPPDGLYSTAVKYDNVSACKSFEAMAGFKPYTLEGQRISVGRQFTWENKQVTCTSIGADALIACSYKPRKAKYYSREKIDRRFTITHAEIAAEDKRLAGLGEEKKMAKAKAEAQNWAKNWHMTDAHKALVMNDQLLAALQDYERARVLDVLKKRFKKVRPTLFQFLVMGYRYRDDHNVVERAVSSLMHAKR